MELKTKYLPINTKRAICEQIVNNSLIEKDGFLFIDYISKEIAEHLSYIQFYSNLNVEEIDYDTIASDGTLENIIKEIPSSEISFINLTVEYMLDQEIQIHNSLSATLSRSLNKLIEKIPDENTIKELASNENLALIQKYADTFTGKSNRQTRRKTKAN